MWWGNNHATSSCALQHPLAGGVGGRGCECGHDSAGVASERRLKVISVDRGPQLTRMNELIRFINGNNAMDGRMGGSQAQREMRV